MTNCESEKTFELVTIKKINVKYITWQIRFMTNCESEDTFELIARDGDRRRRRVSRYDGSRHEIDQKT
jgi:hypothetical protein